MKLKRVSIMSIIEEFKIKDTIECGNNYSGILCNGEVVFVGNNDYGQCSILNEREIRGRVMQISCGNWHTGLLLDDGKVRFFGNNS